MKSSLLRTIRVHAIITTTFVALAACSSFKNQNTSDTYQIPWENADNSYSLQNVKIESLSDPDNLSGDNVKILVGPGAQGGSLAAPQSPGHFIVTKEGTKIPRDTVTLEAITVQAHVERLRALAVKAGVDTVLSWPLTIAVETISADPTAFVNNACFDGNFNALMTSIFTQKKNLPLAMNGGVLGHEFFHMIFNQLVYNRIGGRTGQTGVTQTGDTSDVDTYNDFLLRGMNEGLADFWGWIYSGDDNFIAVSLPQVLKQRDLSYSVTPLQTQDQMKGCLQAAASGLSPYGVGNQIYYVGTRYARFFHGLTLQQFGRDGRELMAKVIMDAIRSFSDTTVARVTSNSEISPNDILFAVFDRLPSVTDDTCNLYDQVAAANGAELADRPAKCQSFPRHADLQSARQRSELNNFSCGPTS